MRNVDEVAVCVSTFLLILVEKRFKWQLARLYDVHASPLTDSDYGNSIRPGFESYFRLPYNGRWSLAVAGQGHISIVMMTGRNANYTGHIILQYS
jgi:hypothetical protein